MNEYYTCLVLSLSTKLFRDINEYEEGTHRCEAAIPAATTDCVNTTGSFRCKPLTPVHLYYAVTQLVDV